MFTEKKPDAQRVALVGCSATKLNRKAPARELYTSSLFRASYEYAEKTCDAVLIVSTFHGLVTPDTVLEPYDRNLRKLRKIERESWGMRTIGALGSKFKVPPLLVILAGKVYAEALVFGAHWHGLPKPEEPLERIVGIGPRVAWLKANTPNSTGASVCQPGAATGPMPGAAKQERQRR